MNPLTQVKQIQKMSSAEAALGVSEGASWHAKYKDSAYVFVGGIPYELTEGDLLAVFSQYGEIVDVNLVRDKGTGKSKGFAFLAYEDQRSTVLAVDNLNGAKVLGRIVRVDHVSKYKKKEEEDEEEEQRKREERGVCRAFQRGECTRGDACKFSHNEMRAANTGWGERDESSSKWDHDKYDGRKWNNYPANQGALNSSSSFKAERTERRSERDDHRSRKHGNEVSDRLPHNRKADGHKEEDDKPRGVTKQLDKYEAERGEKVDSKHIVQGKRKDDLGRREESSSRYEKRRDEPDMNDSDVSYDERRKDKQSRDGRDDRSGRKDKNMHESSKRTKYEDSSSYRHRDESQSHHRSDRRK